MAAATASNCSRGPASPGLMTWSNTSRRSYRASSVPVNLTGPHPYRARSSPRPSPSAPTARTGLAGAVRWVTVSPPGSLSIGCDVHGGRRGPRARSGSRSGRRSPRFPIREVHPIPTSCFGRPTRPMSKDSHSVGRPRTASRPNGPQPDTNRPGTAGAICHGTMSCGESSAVSIQRRHGRPSSRSGSSNSSGSQYAFRMRWKREPFAVEAPRPARRCANCRPSPAGAVSRRARPCSPARASVVRLMRWRSCSTSRSDRRAISSLTKRCTSACFASSDQSNQLISLSWQ